MLWHRNKCKCLCICWPRNLLSLVWHVCRWKCSGKLWLPQTQTQWQSMLVLVGWWFEVLINTHLNGTFVGPPSSWQRFRPTLLARFEPCRCLLIPVYFYGRIMLAIKYVYDKYYQYIPLSTLLSSLPSLLREFLRFQFLWYVYQ